MLPFLQHGVCHLPRLAARAIPGRQDRCCPLSHPQRLLTLIIGQGEAENGMPGTSNTPEPAPPEETYAFAPATSSIMFPKPRRRPPRLLNLEVPATKGAMAKMHETCSVRSFSRPISTANTNMYPMTKSAIHGRLGWNKNAGFLEQFRYIIVASQLLNEHSQPATYKRQSPPPPPGDWPLKSEQECGSKLSPVGLAVTGATAIALAYLIKRLQGVKVSDYGITTIGIVASLIVLMATLLYYYARHQWLHYLRARSMENATLLTNNAQNFDAAASAAFTLIQEVELVSRGYNM